MNLNSTSKRLLQIFTNSLACFTVKLSLYLNHARWYCSMKGSMRREESCHQHPCTTIWRSMMICSEVTSHPWSAHMSSIAWHRKPISLMHYASQLLELYQTNWLSPVKRYYFQKKIWAGSKMPPTTFTVLVTSTLLQSSGLPWSALSHQSLSPD